MHDHSEIYDHNEMHDHSENVKTYGETRVKKFR